MLIRQEDATKEFGLSASTLRKLVKDGKLTEYRTDGNHRRYDKLELERFLTIVKE